MPISTPLKNTGNTFNMNDVLEKADQAVKRREAIALCTVVETVGSVPMKPGAKLLVWQDGRSYGTIGGGNVEKQVIDDAVQLISHAKSETKEYHLLALKMCCGGTMKIFIDSLPVNRQLLVFGAGHIGKHIIDFANKLHFQLTVIDERDEFINSIQLPAASKLSLSHEAALPLLVFDRHTYIVICTHQHEYDRAILSYCIQKPHAYLGMIGSRRKVIITKKQFLQQAICTEEQLNKVDMPMGYDLGQNNPAEIALGIIAKILATANGKSLNSFTQNKNHHETYSDSDRCG